MWGGRVWVVWVKLWSRLLQGEAVRGGEEGARAAAEAANNYGEEGSRAIWGAGCARSCGSFSREHRRRTCSWIGGVLASVSRSCWRR